MNGSLIILIILIIIIIIIVLTTTPTCKNAVSSVIKGKSKSQNENLPAVVKQIEQPKPVIIQSKPQHQNVPQIAKPVVQQEPKAIVIQAKPQTQNVPQVPQFDYSAIAKQFAQVPQVAQPVIQHQEVEVAQQPQVPQFDYSAIANQFAQFQATQPVIQHQEVEVAQQPQQPQVPQFDYSAIAKQFAQVPQAQAAQPIIQQEVELQQPQVPQSEAIQHEVVDRETLLDKRNEQIKTMMAKSKNKVNEKQDVYEPLVSISKHNEFVPILEGPIENLFDTKLDVQAEFGMTEAEIDRLAKDHYERHLAPKTQARTRHRSVLRTETENAEQALRESFVNTVQLGNRMSAEQFTNDAMRNNIINAEKSKSNTKRSARSKTFIINQ